jgi:predicted nucleotidyltransferase
VLETAQTARVVDIVRSVLGDDLLGAYLYGSSVQGGLKPRSDVDVLAVSARGTTIPEKRTVIDRLLPISGSRAMGGPARSLEVTIVVQSDVRPWRYPPPLDFQYGDWFRKEYARGDTTPWRSPNPDVAVLLTTVLLRSEPLAGPPAAELLDPVPRADLDRAMREGIPDLLADLDGDEANVLLTFARIWATLETGEILPKDAAADWAIERLPAPSRATLERARAIYLGEAADEWDDLRPRVPADAEVVIGEIGRVRP